MRMKAVTQALELGACLVQSATGLQPVPSFEGCNPFKMYLPLLKLWIQSGRYLLLNFLFFLVACNNLFLLKGPENFCQGKITRSNNNLGCTGPLEVTKSNLLLKAGLTSKSDQMIVI